MSSPLYAYYGDDFTGSTDVLEVLASAGVRSVLFIGPPSAMRERGFSDCQAFGIAGDSRSRTPQWMSEHLPALFARLGEFGAPIAHYKTCSTFDSSPRLGSIGRALEIGRDTWAGPFIPIVVAAPHLGRYVAFGNLFAAAGGVVHRIDRHPSMRAHPVTPMHEADLRRHLAAQTTMRVGLVALPTLARNAAAEALADCQSAGEEAVLFDGVSEADLAQTGRVLWRAAERHALFCAGSSGLPYALLTPWREAGLIPERFEPPRHSKPVDTLLVISGSCSPVTERQIHSALRAGYHGIALDPKVLLSEAHGPQTGERLVQQAVCNLRAGRSTIVYSALGPLGAGISASGEALGRCLGDLLSRILAQAPVPRVLLAGGDTSSHAVSRLGLQALTWLASLEPGAPLCRAHTDTQSGLDGLELVLKGGQVGSEAFFERVRLGR